MQNDVIYFEKPDREFLINNYLRYAEYLKSKKDLNWVLLDDEQLHHIEWWVLAKIVDGMASAVDRYINRV